MRHNVSTRCGKGMCSSYDPFNKVSKCKIFSDRRECPKSKKQRKKVAYQAKRKSI